MERRSVDGDWSILFSFAEIVFCGIGSLEETTIAEVALYDDIN